MTVTCIRCNRDLESYVFTRLRLSSDESERAHVMLECSACGHVEFLSRTSPLLSRLQAAPTFVGDGD